MRELIRKIIEEAKNGTVDPRVKEIVRYDNTYAILKDSVEVRVRLKTGYEISIDVTDLVLNEQ